MAEGGEWATYSSSVCACVCVHEKEGEREHEPPPPNPNTSNGFFRDHMSFASAQQQHRLYGYSRVRRERQTCCIIEGGRWKVEGINLCVCMYVCVCVCGELQSVFEEADLSVLPYHR